MSESNFSSSSIEFNHKESLEQSDAKAPYDKENKSIRPHLNTYGNVEDNLKTLEVNGDKY